MAPLVILGCGYVGLAAARAALTREREVHALTRSPERAEALRRIGLKTVVAADIAGRAWHAKLPCAGADVLFCVATGGADSVVFRRTYVDGMTSALEWARRGEIENFAYTSSTGVYKETGGVTVDETSPVGGDTRSDALLETENLLLAGAAKKGSGIRRAFVLRLAGLYGPDRHYMLDALRRGETTFAGSGDFRINYLHRDDAVGALLCALNLENEIPGGVFNITDGRPAKKADIASWLATRVGAPAPTFDPTKTTARGARRGSGSPDRIVSNAKARKILRWSPSHPDFRSGYEAILRGC